MRTRRRLSAADRRSAILAAALDVFSERGFGEASLDDVAARDGVSKALIYEHFSSKRELQIALLDTYVHDLLDRVTAATASAAPGEDRLRAGVDAFLAFVGERPDAWRMLARNFSDPDAAATLASLQEEIAATIASVMVADAPPPRDDDIDLDRAVAMLAHLLSGAIQSLADWWVGHPEVEREQALEMVMDFAWLGFERLEAGERWGR